jgi:hypothetical protein
VCRVPGAARRVPLRAARGGRCAAARAAGRFDRRCWALLGGPAATLPYAFWNAYVARRSYTDSNGVPGPATLAEGIVLALAGGLVARYAARAIARRWPRLDLARPHDLPRPWHIVIGLSASLIAATDQVERSFAETNMKWLS